MNQELNAKKPGKQGWLDDSFGASAAAARRSFSEGGWPMWV